MRVRSAFDHVDRAPPVACDGVPIWERTAGSWRLRALGRGVERKLAEGLGPLQPPVPLAWLTQRHTDLVLEAAPGDCGVGDALLVAAGGIAGVVATADCLPLAVVRGARAVLVHAGWRGVAAGLPARAAERLGRGSGAEAWIGPAIGPCCYEVGEDVADKVRRASGDGVVIATDGGRPRLDLRLAAALQLRAAGVERIRLLDHCTRCRGEWLWSHRREPVRAGRNLTLLWRENEEG